MYILLSCDPTARRFDWGLYFKTSIHYFESVDLNIYFFRLFTVLTDKVPSFIPIAKWPFLFNARALDCWFGDVRDKDDATFPFILNFFPATSFIVAYCYIFFVLTLNAIILLSSPLEYTMSFPTANPHV
jgi:hypothetical protein